MTLNAAYHLTPEQINKEADLIRQAKEDPSKFALLYNKYHEQIFLFIVRRVESKDDAADITSQVFLKAMLNLKKYQPQGIPFGSWLYRIARNEIYDQNARNIISMVLTVEKEGVREMAAEIEGENNSEEKYNQLQNALTTLSEDELEIIELRYFEKHSFKEVGEIVNITENNAKVKTYRILEKLKNNFTHE
ncbi:MAG: sigma-70 family RNA polymerase sigma factor [Bacteroidetes bacterium]|nr:sigma-70 family RNA polymerase sigma factor [Bacteroidota bacterium]